MLRENTILINKEVLTLFKEGLDKEVKRLRKLDPLLHPRRDYLIAMTEAQIRICEYILEGKFNYHG